MLKSIQQRDLDKNRWIKITMTVILVVICVSMVITLIPGLMSGSIMSSSPDTVATVNGQDITIVNVQQQLAQTTRQQSIPEAMRGIYARQILDQMIFQRALGVEADRLGLQVTDDEETQRIRQILPDAWSGDTWLKDKYVTEVQTRTGMTVSEFETALRDQMLADKFRSIVTDGITVSPTEIEREYRMRNEKVKIAYVLIKPEDLAATIRPSDSDLAAYFAKNSSRYSIAQKRSARYALLDMAKLSARTQVTDDELRAYYNANIDQYKVENRVHVEHILFKTVGKTDAEITEIRQKAEDVLKQAKHGANFEDLAKKYSEDDATKPKGGDLDWIVEGQTVPEFQQTAFSLPKGSISDLVKTEYGFHIIKVIDHETARTKSLDEVRSTITPILLDAKVKAAADNLANQIASAIRQSNRQSLDDLAKKFNLDLGETQPAGINDPVGALGSAPDVHQALFQLTQGELSQPILIDNGYVVLAVKDILPAHQGTLAEVHDTVLTDYQNEQALTLARTKADDLSKLIQSGTPLDKAAKSLGLEVKTSESFARTGSIPDVGTGKQVADAFTMALGQVSKPVQSGSNWLVYSVVAHDSPNPDDLAKQAPDIQQTLLQTKQDAAFDAFRTALEDRLKAEGKLNVNPVVLKQLTSNS
jgi:peptidyl-prolyl cis-trans isomerase D